MVVPAALHFLGLFARPLQEPSQPSAKMMQELPTALVEGPRAREHVWQRPRKNGCKHPPWLQCRYSAERLLLSARKQSAFCLAQLVVQKISLSLCGGVSSPLLKNPVIQSVFGRGKEPPSYEERDKSQPWPYGTINPSGVSGTALPPAPQGQ